MPLKPRCTNNLPIICKVQIYFLSLQPKRKRLKMKKAIIVIYCLLGLISVCQAQNHLRIHYKNGTQADVPIAQIDSITFVEESSATPEPKLERKWFWGSQEQGYYELLTINEDHTYTGYDNFFTYGFDTMTYGWWAQIGAMLTLQSNGFGYQRRYNWYITELTDNVLSVMTNMGPFTYYSVQSETLSMQVSGTLACEEGDSFVFADGVKVAIQDNKLVGLMAGETYVLKYLAATKSIVSYKVVVI